jgi:hypothetical protein
VSTDPVAYVIAEPIGDQILVLSTPRSSYPTREAANAELARSRSHGLPPDFDIYGLVELSDD